MHGQANRSPLVCKCARHRLADPPGRVGRKLVAHLVVELLDRANQAEVPLLDQVEERYSRLRVVAGDRHHEPEVRLDQLALGRLVPRILPASEVPLLEPRQQRSAADRADVELQRILGLHGPLERFELLRSRAFLGLGGLLDGGFELDRLRVVERGNELQARLDGAGGVDRSCQRPLFDHAPCTGGGGGVLDSSRGDRPVAAEPIANLGSSPSSNLTRVYSEEFFTNPMCGIAGYSLSSRSAVDRTLAAQSLLAGIAERGADAVGYAHRRAGHYAVVTKQRTPASQLLERIDVPQAATELPVHV